MLYKNGFDAHDYGVLLEENGEFVNRGKGLYMPTPSTVPNYGYLDGEKQSIFNCYMAYIGNDRVFDTWILIDGICIDIVDNCQFTRSFDTEWMLKDENEIDIIGPKYQLYLTRLTDYKPTERYYMGVKLYRDDKLYKNCRIIFGLGINPNGIEDLNFFSKHYSDPVILEYNEQLSKYHFTNSELRELSDWFKD